MDQLRLCPALIGTPEITAKLRIGAGLAHSLQLIEKCCVSILRRNVKRRSRQCWVNRGGVVQILLRDLPGIRDDSGITAEIAEEPEVLSPRPCAGGSLRLDLNSGCPTLPDLSNVPAH